MSYLVVDTEFHILFKDGFFIQLVKNYFIVENLCESTLTHYIRIIIIIFMSLIIIFNIVLLFNYLFIHSFKLLVDLSLD